MYLIVGLGNPEPEYSKTRHNMGFDVINKLAKQYEIELSRNIRYRHNRKWKSNLVKTTNIYEFEWTINKKIYRLL